MLYILLMFIVDVDVDVIYLVNVLMFMSFR